MRKLAMKGKGLVLGGFSGMWLPVAFVPRSWEKSWQKYVWPGGWEWGDRVPAVCVPGSWERGEVFLGQTGRLEMWLGECEMGEGGQNLLIKQLGGVVRRAGACKTVGFPQ
jgi:hypothetical protein